MEVLRYNQEAITNDLVATVSSLHEELGLFINTLFFSCFLIAIMWRYIEMHKIAVDNPDQAHPFPIGSLLLQLSIILLIYINLDTIFTSTISLMNYLADKIFTVDQTINLITKLFSKDFFSGEHWYSINIKSLFGAIIVFCAQMFALITCSWRYFLLIFYFLLAPFFLARSLIPAYGPRTILDYLQNILQIASWPIFISLLNWVFNTVSNNSWDKPSYEYLTFMCLYAVGNIWLVPRFAKEIFGGSDYAPLTLITAALAKSSLHMAAKPAMGAASVAGKLGGAVGSAIGAKGVVNGLSNTVGAGFKGIADNVQQETIMRNVQTSAMTQYGVNQIKDSFNSAGEWSKGVFNKISPNKGE